MTGEFIVSLQIVRLKIDGLRLRMTTEVHHQRCGGGCSLMSLTKQKGNRRSARGVAFECLTEGASQGGCAVEVQQFEQLSGLRAD